MFLFFGKEVMNNGGGGLIYIGGVCTVHIRGGGVLGAGTTQRGGGLRCGQSPGGGVLGAGITRKTRALGAVTSRKKGVFGTGFEKREGLKN